VKEKSTELVATSSPTWEALEAFARQSMQQFLQRMLEEEVDGLLGAAGMSAASPWMLSPATVMVLASRAD